MKNIFWLVFSLSLFFFLPSESTGMTIKVSNAQELTNRLRNSLPGDTLILANGIWKDQQLLIKASGKPGMPITLLAETAGKVIITGKSTITVSGNYITVNGLYLKDGEVSKGAVIEVKNSQYCRLTNIAIVDYNSALPNVTTKWISLNGTHLRVDHSYFRNKTTKGPLLGVVVTDTPNNNLIDSNYFDYRTKVGGNGGEIIQIGLGTVAQFSSQTIVEHNYFQECNGEAEIISVKTSDNIIRYNTFVKCQGTVSIRQGENCTVENNYFLGENVNKTGGVKIFGENHKIINNYFADLKGKNLYAAIVIMNGGEKNKDSFAVYPRVKNVLIENNKFINNAENVAIGINYNNNVKRTLTPLNVSFLKNIFYMGNGTGINVISNPVNFNWQENVIYESGADSNIPNGFIKTDPKLVKGKDNIWRASDASPSVLRTTASINSTTSQPLTGKEVGPNWLNE